MVTFGSIYSCSGHWLQAAKNAKYQLIGGWEPSGMKRNAMRNFPYCDMREIEAAEMLGGADVLAGSPPCNGMCAANPARYPDHPSNDNVYNACKLANQIEPKVFIMEETNNFLKPINAKVKDKAERILKSKFGYVYFIGINLGDLLDIQDRKRSLTIASQVELDTNKLIKPGRPIEWQSIAGGVHPETYHEFNIELMPYKTMMKANNRWKNRIVNHRKRFFSITGDATRSIIVEGPEQAYRFISTEEIAAIQGFPPGYKWALPSIGFITNSVARGVPIREMALILSRLKQQL